MFITRNCADPKSLIFSYPIPTPQSSQGSLPVSFLALPAVIFPITLNSEDFTQLWSDNTRKRKLKLKKDERRTI